MPVDQSLNPAQRATLAALGAGDLDARAEFDPALTHELRSRLESALAPLTDRLPGNRPLTVTKHLLNGMHECQARFLDEQTRPFEATVPIVRGTIAHKALELAVHWPTTPLPLDLVDAAIERVDTSDHWASEFVRACTPADRAELRGTAAEIVHQFLETWPPLTSTMRPATEAKLWAELVEGRILLKGQADLTLGQPVASGARARKIIVDYKTGSRLASHRSDLRFYALVETLRLGVPPRLLVTSYLTTASLQSEPVTEELLIAAAARTIDGIHAHVDLTCGPAADRAEPVKRPSFACRWCALLDSCEVGQSHLADEEG